MIKHRLLAVPFIEKACIRAKHGQMFKIDTDTREVHFRVIGNVKNNIMKQVARKVVKHIHAYPEELFDAQDFNVAFEAWFVKICLRHTRASKSDMHIQYEKDMVTEAEELMFKHFIPASLKLQRERDKEVQKAKEREDIDDFDFDESDYTGAVLPSENKEKIIQSNNMRENIKSYPNEPMPSSDNVIALGLKDGRTVSVSFTGSLTTDDIEMLTSYLKYRTS